MAKRPTITTPRGRLKYPRIIGKPDTKFNADGEWKTQFILDVNEPGAEEFLNKIREAHKQAIVDETKKQQEKANGKKVVVKEGELPFTESEDGQTVELRARLKVKGENKKTGETWTNTVVIFDKKGKPITDQKIRIGGGSLAKFTAEMNPFYVAASKTAGVSLRLKAVQIIELVEFGGDASQYGFGNEEDDEDTDTTTTTDAEETTDETPQSGSDF